MLRILIIIFSILLSLGLFSEKYFPYLKEGVIGVLFIYILVSVKNFTVFKANIKNAFPLFLIFFILLIIGALKPYHLDGESAFNLKFLASILFYIFLSTFFSIYPNLIQTSLVSFGIGAGLLCLLFTFNILGESAYEIRNDRLILLGENPNSLSIRISLGVLFLVWAALENGLKLSKFKRFLLLLPIPFMFNLIIISGSKGSFLLCVGSLSLYVFLLKNVSIKLKRFVLFFASVIVFFAISIFFESALYTRFIESELTSGRSDIWNTALDISSDNIFGVGEVGYKIEIFNSIGKIIDTHNLFIYLLVTGGVLSLLLFLFFLYVLFVRLLRSYVIDRNIINLLIFFSMLFVMSKTGGVLSYLIMWYFLACVNVESFNRKTV